MKNTTTLILAAVLALASGLACAAGSSLTKTAGLFAAAQERGSIVVGYTGTRDVTTCAVAAKAISRELPQLLPVEYKRLGSADLAAELLAAKKIDIYCADIPESRD